MNIREIISEKKKAIHNRLKTRADARMFVELDELEEIRKRREEEEKRAFIHEQLRNEKIAIRELKMRKFKNTLSKVRGGLQKMKERSNQREMERVGVHAK